MIRRKKEQEVQLKAMNAAIDRLENRVMCLEGRLDRVIAKVRSCLMMLKKGGEKMRLFKQEDKDSPLEELDLFGLCEWWIETYPEDVFTKPTEIVEIRKLMQKILSERKGAKK